MSKKIIWALVIVGIAIIGIFLYGKSGPTMAGMSQSQAYDLIGTKLGTTVTGVGFYANHRDTSVGGVSVGTATTTYKVNIGGDTDVITFSFFSVQASSTGANMGFRFLATNDQYCATTSVSTTATSTKDIQWFDIGRHILGTSTPTNFDLATTTMSWTNPAGGREITLTDLNYQCVAVQVGASSTVLFSQYRLKEY